MATPIEPPSPKAIAAGTAVAQACQIIAQLRGPSGCRWTAAQTCSDLAPYMIEEAHEAAQAAATADMPALQEELGDVLMQVLYLSEVACEGGHFSLADVAETLQRKLVRRSPHVFADAKAADAAQAAQQWEAIKATERAERAQRSGGVRLPEEEAGRLAGVPATLPALLRAQRVLEKAADLRPEVVGVPAAWAALAEAFAEQQPVGAALGQLLLAVVQLCDKAAINAETALQGATSTLARQVGAVEKALAARGHKSTATGGDDALDDVRALWDEAQKQTP